MKKFLVLLLLLSVLLLSSTAVLAKGGYDEFGYNRTARIFNGFYGYYDKNIEGGWLPGTYDSWLLMKWSKDWAPMTDQPEGAWCTNHVIWYSNDFNEETGYGWETKLPWTDEITPNASYKIESFIKIMKVSDDAEAWTEYEAAGAYSANWGNYESGVPKYVVFQDVVEVYNVESGELVASYEFVNGVAKGLGKPIF